MTDKPDTRVSMSKSGPASGASRATARPAPPKATGPRPRTIVGTVVALVLAGLFAVVAALTLFGQRDYLFNTALKNRPVPPLTSSLVSSQGTKFRSFLQQDLTQHPQLGSAQVSARASDVQNWVTHNLPASHVSSADITDQAGKMHDAVSSSLGGVSGSTLSQQQIGNQTSSLTNTYVNNLTTLRKGQPARLSVKQIRDQANSAPRQYLIPNVVLLLVLGLVASLVWRGRHWSRWAVLGVWVLSTLGGSFAGINGVFSIATSLPAPFKYTYFIASLSFIAAVLLVNMRGSTEWLNAHRPAGLPQRRGLFTPRPPRGPTGASRTAATRPAATSPAPAAGATAADRDRGKAKQRASAEAVAKGAELARSRAKASGKSRRTGA